MNVTDIYSNMSTMKNTNNTTFLSGLMEQKVKSHLSGEECKKLGDSSEERN